MFSESLAFILRHCVITSIQLSKKFFFELKMETTVPDKISKIGQDK